MRRVMIYRPETKEFYTGIRGLWTKDVKKAFKYEYEDGVKAIGTMRTDVILMWCGENQHPKSDSQRRKETPIYSGLMAYFPDALAAVAHVSFKGNEKHNPGQPLHWSREKSTDHLDCVARHIMTPTDIDPDSGEMHLAHAAWRVLAQLQLELEKRNAVHTP